MCSAVVPQHPPMILTPVIRNRRAYCDIYSGEHKYRLRPSTVVGRPALGIALSGLRVYPTIFSIASSITLGPEEQFSPITSTGSSSSLRVKSSVDVPSRRL